MKYGWQYTLLRFSRSLGSGAKLAVAERVDFIILVIDQQNMTSCEN